MYKKKVVYEAYKLLWLYQYADLSSLRNFLLNLLKSDGKKKRIVKCYEYKYKDRDHSNADGKPREVRNGDIIFEISYLEDEKISDIRGEHKYKGHKIRIVKKGDDEKCFGCKEPGHIIANCPNLEIICEKCSKKGHRVCTYSD